MSTADTPPLSRRGRWVVAIAWPSFLMAGLLEGLVFALIDPSDLSWFGGAPVGLSRQAIYTLGFLIFWCVTALAASLSLLLLSLPEPPPDAHPRGWPR